MVLTLSYIETNYKIKNNNIISILVCQGVSNVGMK